MNTMSRGLIALFSLIAIGHAGAQTCVQPPPGLVSWWPGDGNAGDIENVNNGTLQGGANFAAGMVGQAFSLNGVDAFVEAPENGSLDLNGPFTIDLWVNPNGPEGPLVSKYDFGTSNFQNVAYEVGLHSGGVLQFGVTCGMDNMFRQTVPGVLPPNVFSHVAVIYSTNPSPALAIYVNGVAQPGTTVGVVQCTFINQNDTPFRIGKRIGAVEGEQFFHGLIDEVEVFNRALSASEIQAIYNAGSVGKCKATTTTLDHFQCYAAKGEAPKVYVDLKDQFGAATVFVGKPEFFCNPVDKNGEGIRNPAAHFTCYKIKAKGAKRDVSVGDQFGEQTLDLNDPELLCVPADKIKVRQ